MAPNYTVSNNPSSRAVEGPQGQEARPISQVQSQVQRSQVMIENLSQRLHALRERLAPVLRENKEPEGSKASAPTPILVGHAEALSNHNEQLGMLVDFVEDVLNRLEL